MSNRVYAYYAFGIIYNSKENEHDLRTIMESYTVRGDLKVDMVPHGYRDDDLSGACLCIKDSIIEVMEGAVSLFNKPTYPDLPAWVIILKEFCEKHDLKYDNPSWTLSSYYG